MKTIKSKGSIRRGNVMKIYIGRSAQRDLSWEETSLYA